MWWALAGLLAIAGFGSWLAVGRSKRRRWDETFEAERTQAQWLLGELLPSMADGATAPSALAVLWANAQPALDQLDTSLTSLVAGAPDETRRSTARQISDSVSEVRRVVTADLALRTGTAGIPADAPALAASALLVQTARDKLAAAITLPA